MRLVFIMFDYFPFGGLQRDGVKLAQMCACRGHDVHLLTRTWQGDPLHHKNITVHLLGRKGWSNISRNRHFIRQLAQTIPQLQPDGVIGMNKLPGLDLYFACDSCYWARLHRLQPRWKHFLPRARHFQWLENQVFAKGHKTQILLLHEGELDLYRKQYGTEPERFHVLPPGIHLTPIQNLLPQKDSIRESIRIEFGWPLSTPIILFVGSGFRTKGLDRALRGIASLAPQLKSQVQFLVIGQNDPTAFQLLARQLGIAPQVHFLGGRNDVPRFLLAADLLLHPAYSENTGTVLLEAMIAGLPVLTTDTCGFSVHVTKAQGGTVLPSPFQSEHLSQALVNHLTPSCQQVWSLNAMNYVSQTSLTGCHEKAVTLIESLLPL